MKKNSKILLPLLTLLISGCTPNTSGSSEPPSSSSETPVEPASKIKMSLASTVATDRGDVQIQTNNQPAKTKIDEDNNKRHSLNRTPDPSEVSYTILESSATSFDIAISGLQDGLFNIEIKKLLVNEDEPSDVTKDYSWVMKYWALDKDKTGGKEVKTSIYSLDETQENYQPLKWGKNYDGETYDVKRETFHEEESNTDIEYRIYRIQSPGNFELNVSELQVRVYQDIQVEVDEPEISGLRIFSPKRTVETRTIEGFMVVNTFNFEVEYDNVEDEDYTDLNNLRVKIDSNTYDVEYKSKTSNFVDNEFIELSIEDNELTPYEPIDIRYREKEYAGIWTYVQDFLVVFPHVGNINLQSLSLDQVPLKNEIFRISLGQRDWDLGFQYLRIIYNNFSSTADLRTSRNFMWTGLKISYSNIIITIGSIEIGVWNSENHDVIRTDESVRTRPQEVFGENSKIKIGDVTFSLGTFIENTMTQEHYFSGTSFIKNN